MAHITYRDGYKHQLTEDYIIDTGIKPAGLVVTRFLVLSLDGRLTVLKGYAWDGPSGPTFDSPSFMRGSLVHDALYQLMRDEYLDHDICRESADRLLQKLCLEDRMNPLRAKWVYEAVRTYGEPSADPARRRPVVMAPGET